MYDANIMKKSSRFYLKYNPDNRWSFWTGKWCSLYSEISGQFTPKLGGQFDRLFHGGCYLLLGTVEVDFHFPTITIHKMAKMPFIPDPRYSMDKEKSLEAARTLHEDVSMTQRKPYPQEHEIGLPRQKMI
jgi:hypothetical protein